MEPLLEINHINYAYHSMQGETPALQNIHFTVCKGDFIAVVGPSGCGKTTLLSPDRRSAPTGRRRNPAKRKTLTGAI